MTVLLLIKLIINGQYIGELQSLDYPQGNQQEIIIEVIPDLIFTGDFENEQ